MISNVGVARPFSMRERRDAEMPVRKDNSPCDILKRARRARQFRPRRLARSDVAARMILAGAAVSGCSISAIPASCGLARSSAGDAQPSFRSEEHTSELQLLMRHSYAVF